MLRSLDVTWKQASRSEILSELLSVVKTPTGLRGDGLEIAVGTDDGWFLLRNANEKHLRSCSPAYVLSLAQIYIYEC